MTLDRIAKYEMSMHYRSPDGQTFGSRTDAISAIYAYAPHTHVIAANWGDASGVIHVVPASLSLHDNVGALGHDPRKAARFAFGSGKGYWVVSASYNRDDNKWEFSVSGEFES